LYKNKAFDFLFDIVKSKKCSFAYYLKGVKFFSFFELFPKKAEVIVSFGHKNFLDERVKLKNHSKRGCSSLKKN
jgi:hypothetical protein